MSTDRKTTRIERVLSLVDGEPKVIAANRVDGQTLRLTLSFRGCDDDAFSIDADLLSIRFWDEEETA